MPRIVWVVVLAVASGLLVASERWELRALGIVCALCNLLIVCNWEKDL